MLAGLNRWAFSIALATQSNLQVLPPWFGLPGAGLGRLLSKPRPCAADRILPQEVKFSIMKYSNGAF